MYNIIKELCLANGISMSKLATKLGFRASVFTELKSGRTKKLSTDKIAKIAEYFDVSTDYILGKEDKKEKTSLPEGEVDLSEYMQTLLNQETLMFDGEPLDGESKELLLISLRNTMELAKKLKNQKKTDLSD